MEASYSSAAVDLPPIKDIGIRKFYELIGELLPESAGDTLTQETGDGPGELVFGTLQAFIDVLESCLRDKELEIYQRGDCAPTGRRLGSATLFRPDVAIFRRKYALSQDEDKAFWGSIEMAIKYHSARKTREQRLEEAADYVAYLLNARPDLISALGLLVEPDSLDFLFCNVGGICKLSLSNKVEYIPLLSAVLRYLNGRQKKNLDPTLVRVQGSSLFDVSFPNASTSLGFTKGQATTYPACFLHCSHKPFRCRASIFIYKPATDVTAIRVIKDQYIKRNRRWDEKQILAKIHADGPYPAVVRMCFADEIMQARCGDHIRVRVCLQDYGTDFLSLKTPRDMIYALYDLLEVTRGLYFDRKILHRDISPWNIMIRNPQDTDHIETCSTTSPVFIRHLLDPQEPKHKTSIFLIDFGYSQDLDSSGPCSEQVGTPIFIARAVQAGEPLPSRPLMAFPGLPPLSADARAVYESNYPKRMELFNGAFTPQFGSCNNPPLPFQHKLAHDGESGIWTAVWWSIRASPEKGEENPIYTGYWHMLMPKYSGSRTGLPDYDGRDEVLSAFARAAKGVLHPGYSDLVGLFQSLAAAIIPDYHWAEDPIRQRPDFVHEILQRIIFDFLVTNKDKSFMDEKKADTNRTIVRRTNRAHLSLSKTESQRSSSITSKKSSVSSQGRKRKLKETVPDPVELADTLSEADEFNDTHSDCDGDHDEEDTCRFVKKSRANDLVINVEAE